MADAATKEVLWSRSFTLTITGILFVFIPFALYLPVMPVYLLKKMHSSIEAAGAVNAIFLIACVLFRAQTARLEAHFGTRQVLLTAGFLFMATNALYLAAGTVASVLAIRFLSGACFAVANTAINAMGSRLIPKSRKGEGLAYLTTMVLAGTAIGPYLGLSLSRSFGYDAVFIFSTVSSLFGMLIFCLIRIPPERPLVQPFSFRSIYEVKAIPVSLVVLLLAVAYGGVLTFMAVYAADLRLPLVVDFFFVVMPTASVGSRLLTGRMYDRFGPNATIYPPILIFALGLLVVATLHTTAWMLVGAALIGVGYGSSVPAIQTLAIQISPAHRVSEVTATFFTCLDGGIGLGAYLLGSSIHAFGYAPVYQGLAALTLSCMLIYYLVYARTRKW
jgi:MFS family permease